VNWGVATSFSSRAFGTSGKGRKPPCRLKPACEHADLAERTSRPLADATARAKVRDSTSVAPNANVYTLRYNLG